MMRLSVFAACVALLGIVGATPVHAQRGVDTTERPSGLDAIVVGPQGDQTVKEICKALDGQTKLDSRGLPLQDVLHDLARQHGLEIQLDLDDAEKESLREKKPLAVQIEGITLRSALRLILDPLDIAWSIGNRKLLVTTRKAADRTLTTAVYPVGDLMTPRFAGHEWKRGARMGDKPNRIVMRDENFADLESLIYQAVFPDTWEDFSGRRGILPIPEAHSLIVVQTDDVHNRLAALLSALRQSRMGQRGSMPKLQSIEVVNPAELPSLERINKALDEPADFDFTDRPLEEVVTLLEERHKIPFLLDAKALADAGVTGETPITCLLQGITLRSALRTMLGKLDLRYMIRNEVLLITTSDRANHQLGVTVYPAADLAMYPTGESWTQSYQDLQDLITTTVAPTGWWEGNGPDLGFSQGRSLVIEQTDEVREEISYLLAALRQARDAQLAVKRVFDPVEAVTRAETKARVKIRTALEEKTKFDFHEMALRDVMNAFKQQHHIEIWLDLWHLEDAGVSPNQAMTARADGVKLRDALKLLLEPIGLDYVFKNEMLWITSHDQVDNELIAKVYPVGDLVALSYGYTKESDTSKFVDAIEKNVTPAGWSGVGGTGNLRAFVEARSIVVSQTDKVHDKIAQYFAALRRARPAEQPASDEAK